MPTISIGSTIINFPDSGTSPNWAPAIIQFAEAVEDTLSGLAGPADVFPQSFTINNFNPGTNVDIPNLTFSTTVVRAAFIRYSLYRTTDTTSSYEAGQITIVYNPNGPTGNKWEYDRNYVGNGQISFNITDVGQVQFTTTQLAGLNHTGQLTYAAQALLQS